LQDSVATLFRRSWKILSYFVANLSKTLRINFRQNRSSIVEVMTNRIWCVFMPHGVISGGAFVVDVETDWFCCVLFQVA